MSPQPTTPTFIVIACSLRKTAHRLGADARESLETRLGLSCSAMNRLGAGRRRTRAQSFAHGSAPVPTSAQPSSSDLLALRRDVLDMRRRRGDRDSARSRRRGSPPPRTTQARSASHNNLVAEQMRDRQRAVRQRLELEVVIVPGDAYAVRRADLAAACSFSPIARQPAESVGRASARQIGRDGVLAPSALRDVDRLASVGDARSSAI